MLGAEITILFIQINNSAKVLQIF